MVCPRHIWLTKELAEAISGIFMDDMEPRMQRIRIVALKHL